MTERYFSIREVAGRFGRNMRTVRRWISAGKLEAVRIPGRHGAEWRISETALEEFLSAEPEPRLSSFPEHKCCAGHTAEGSRCKGPALQGSDFCRWHQGQAEGGQSDD